MICGIRLLVVVVRPAVLLITGMFALVALAQVGHGGDPFLLTRVLVVVVSFLVFSVTVNDIADEAVDGVNLTGDRHRPLVVGTGTRGQLAIMAGVSASAAVVGAAMLAWPVLIVIICSSAPDTRSVLSGSPTAAWWRPSSSPPATSPCLFSSAPSASTRRSDGISWRFSGGSISDSSHRPQGLRGRER